MAAPLILPIFLSILPILAFFTNSTNLLESLRSRPKVPIDKSPHGTVSRLSLFLVGAVVSCQVGFVLLFCFVFNLIWPSNWEGGKKASQPHGT